MAAGASSSAGQLILGMSSRVLSTSTDISPSTLSSAYWILLFAACDWPTRGSLKSPAAGAEAMLLVFTLQLIAFGIACQSGDWRMRLEHCERKPNMAHHFVPPTKCQNETVSSVSHTSTRCTSPSHNRGRRCPQQLCSRKKNNLLTCTVQYRTRTRTRTRRTENSRTGTSTRTYVIPIDPLA